MLIAWRLADGFVQDSVLGLVLGTVLVLSGRTYSRETLGLDLGSGSVLPGRACDRRTLGILIAILGEPFVLHLLVAPVQILVLDLAHEFVQSLVWDLWSSDLGNSSIAIVAPVVSEERRQTWHQRRGQRRGQVLILTWTYCRCPSVRCEILDE